MSEENLIAGPAGVVEPVREYKEAAATRPEEAQRSRQGAHLARHASDGGKALAAKYGSEHMASIGRKGSRAVIKKYGLRFYSEIAARNKGVKKQRRNERPTP